MKRLLLTLSILLGYLQLYAQTITLKEDKIITGEESVNAWIFNVCIDADFARNDIKDFLKDQFDLKTKKKNKYTLIVTEADIPNVSTKRGDLLIYLQHSDTGNIMALSFAMGYDIILNSIDNKVEMDHFRDIAKDFIEYHYNSYYSTIIGDLDKQLNSAKKDLHKKENRISSMKKKEGNMYKKLSKEQDDEKKTELEKDIEELSTEIETDLDLLPALKEQIEILEEDRDKNKSEIMNYQTQIKKI